MESAEGHSISTTCLVLPLQWQVHVLACFSLAAVAALKLEVDEMGGAEHTGKIRASKAQR